MAEYYDLLTDHKQRMPLGPAPEVSEVEHVTVRHEPGWYCAHPRWGVYKDFGGGEVIVGFKMARSAYKEISDIMGVDINQVKVNIFRARKTVKEKLLKVDAYGLDKN